MINFIAIKDQLPPINLLVLIAWESNPFSKIGKPLVAKQACYRINEEYGSGMWFCEFGNPQQWDENEQPTHWALWPEFHFISQNKTIR